MIRCYVGIALLLLLLLAGIWVQTTMQQIHYPIAAAFSQAADAADAAHWPEAAALASHAAAQWQTHRTFTAALADHQPLEDIEALIVQLPSSENADAAAYSALCRELSRRIQAVAEAHVLNLGTVF